MQPLQSPSSNPSTGCPDKVSSRCVTWDGPEITCLDGTKLCKGQTVDYAIYNLAKKLCEVLEAVDITNYANCLPPAPGGIISIKDLFGYVIQNVCTLQTQADAITNAGCPVPTATVAPCLVQFVPGGATTLPVDEYAVLVAGVVCSILNQLTQIEGQIDQINDEIADLWAALANCNKTNEPVQPTCTYDYSLHPNGEPVVIQEAYVWLETAFCDLLGVIGTSADITNAVNKQCADLNNAPRLFGGGSMSNIPGWENSPTTVADSIGNMWLTVCDMRGALDQVLNTCCFSICNYLEFGYDAIWDVDGNFVDITFINYTTIYQADASTNHLNSYSGIPGDTWPPASAPWANNDYPITEMTNVIITLNDGSNQVSIDTGLNIADWLIVSNGTNNGYHVDFTSPAFAGYDPTSVNQTITIQFTYQVNDGQTQTQADCAGPNYCCEVDFTEGFPYECNAPRPSECELEVTFPTPDQVTLKWYGLINETQQYYPAPPIPNASVTVASVNDDELIDGAATWAVNDYQDNIVYIDGGTGAGQCRRIVSNTATILTVSPDWTTPPDATSTYYIANDYIPIPYLNPGLVSYVNNYTITIYNGAGFNPADTSTWVSAYSTTYSGGLNTATSITVTTPPTSIAPNSSYVVGIVANYNCGSSDPTLVYFTSPIAARFQLETIAPTGSLFNAVTGDVYNILSNNNTPVPNSYTATLTFPATFPIELPAALGDSQFNLSLNPGTPAAANTICKCGLQGNPYQTNTSAPDYRDNILGPYRGYEVRLEEFNPTSFTSSPLFDQSAPPIQYKTDSITDPNITFPLNTPVPPIAQIPVGYNQPYFWIKGVYDASNSLASSAIDYHNVYFDTTSFLIINNSGNGAPNVLGPGSFEVEVFKWDQSTTSYISYNPVRKMIFPFMFGVAGTIIGPGATQSFAASINYPNPSSTYTLQCRLGDALRVRITSLPFGGTGTLVAYSYAVSIIASNITPGPSQQYSCAGNPYSSVSTWVVNPPFSITPPPPQTSHNVIITENYDIKIAISLSYT